MAVVGGGPAGMVLGLLLARGGIDTVVLEKHPDFLRDFRGDTVHASTLTLLDELGLGSAFAALPHRLLEEAEVQLDAGTVRLADLGRSLPGLHRHVALVPQWDFLEMLADAAAAEPHFTLLRSAEVVGLVHDAGRVAGVRWRDYRPPAAEDGAAQPAAAGRSAAGPGPSEHLLAADLVVGCDGRWSAVRAGAGLEPRAFGVPVDVEWFRLPRHPGDPDGGVGRLSGREFMIMIDRGDTWQCGYLIAKGQDEALRAEGLGAFRARLARLQPWLADRLDAAPERLDDVKLLDVRIERLDTWHRDGLLLIGDAAHPMSPVGGVGINLAIQDAVAASRIVGQRMRHSPGPVPEDVLAELQRRRLPPTRLVQAFQRLAHRGVVNRALRGALATSATTLPLPLKLLARFPVLQRIPARFIAIGPRPEHAPSWARRLERLGPR
ncbi:Monooxygenase FAD-binding protein [Sinomonas atrocyanea]|uniref:Monooxygenase FAD-binding protein n=1 Tax=Sinomonas atrocyanea TaxID=37927 RepID=A0A127A047_9MICC|nr:Monooxygenase FAD-binding protein [Sinomonas atrocyanea]